MLTINYETLYTSDREYIIILRCERYPNRSRRVRLLCPGSQYLPTIRELFARRGFSFTISEEQ